MNDTSQKTDSPCGSEATTVGRHRATPDLQLCADRLEQLTRRLMTFMQTQFGRMEEFAQEVDAAERQQAELESQSLELTQQQTDWEQHRAVEAERITEETRLLTEAWSRIEEERRERLTTGSDASSLQAVSAAPPETEQAAASLSDTDLFDLGLPTSTQSAAVQFQQIKREIRQHARRNR